MRNRRYIILLLFIVLMPIGVSAQAECRLTSKPVDIAEWVSDNFRSGKTAPFSFTLGGVPSRDFIGKWNFSAENLGETESGVNSSRFIWSDGGTGMKVACEVKGYPAFNAVEWVLYFTNTADADSPQLADVKVVDVEMRYPAEGDATLHYANGTELSKADFHPHSRVLGAGETVSMSPMTGRSSDRAFPFFNIESPSAQGAMVAVGWTGTWYADIAKCAPDGVSLVSGMKWLDTYLLGGETIRTPSICLLFWNGDDRMAGHNKFRRFVLAHQTRKIDGLPTRYPVSTSFNIGDPAPCNVYTCLTTDWALAMIERYKRFGLVPDVFWLDAGWYGESADWDNNKMWANTVGDWRIDQERFPGGFKPIADAVHAAGAKFMVWFEPERAIKGTDWAEKLRPWMLDAEGRDAYLYDLGNREALDWLCSFVGDMMEQNGIDYYRQDFNMDIDNYWRENDAPRRTGIREIRHIEGLYAFWDYLLDRIPNTIVDNCASGGRRIDLESIKRSAPLWRTDYEFGEPIGAQCHTFGLNFFLPISGTGVVDSERFTFRSSLGPTVIYNWKVTEPASSLEDMRRAQREFEEVRPYFLEDYYPLTGCDDTTADDIWLAYQLHRPSDHSGVVVAFRREESPHSSIRVKLSGLDPGTDYIVEDFDRDGERLMTGSELSGGLELSLPEPRSSMLLKYHAR